MDWREAGKEFIGIVDDYTIIAGKDFDLSPSRTAIALLTGKLDELYARIARKTVDQDKANDALMRLARVLVPINYTREARFRHDPAFACPPLPTIAQVSDLVAADPVRAGFIRTQLMRGQNRLTAAMRDAVRIVDAALR